MLYVRRLVTSFLSLPLLALALTWCLEATALADASSSPQRDYGPWRAWVSAPFPCACFHGALGYTLSDYVLVGLNSYQGAGFIFASEYFSRQSGMLIRVKPFGGSLFVEGRLGTLYTMQGHRLNGNFAEDSGTSWGLDLGSEWRMVGRVSHGIVWVGKDEHFKRSRTLLLPHFMRYQIGIKF